MTRTHHGGDSSMTDPAESLRALIREIDLGEIAADEVQRAYLLGAADTLEALADDENVTDGAVQGTSDPD